MRYIVRESGQPDTPPILYEDAHTYCRVRELIHLAGGAQRLGPPAMGLYWEQSLRFPGGKRVTIWMNPADKPLTRQ